MPQELRYQPVIQLPSGEYAIPVYFNKEKSCTVWIGSHYLLIESIMLAVKREPLLDCIVRSTK